MLRPISNQEGLTFIELVIVILIMGFITLALYNLLKAGLDSWQVGDLRADLVQNGRMAMERMTREIRQIRDNSSIVTADTTDLRFIDVGDVTIEYILSGTNLLRYDSSSGATEELANYIQSLQFEYRDRNNNLLSPPVGIPANIWLITIKLSLENKSENSNLRATVKPRNL